MHTTATNKFKKILRTTFCGYAATVLVFMLLTSVQSSSSVLEDGPKVRIETNYGAFVIQLYNGTPQHRDNFLKLVEEDFFKDLLFHRIIRDFMLQTGDPNSKNAGPNAALGKGHLDYTIPAEINSKYIHKKWAVAAARVTDDSNADKASSACQFYIVHGRKYNADALKRLQDRRQDEGFAYSTTQSAIYEKLGGAPHLDGNYTVFGEVIAGAEVLERMAVVGVDPQFRPMDDIRILSTSVEK